MMRILFIAMSESIHTARWLSHINNEGWKIYLFPARWGRLHPTIERVTYFSFSLRRPRKGQNVHNIRLTAILYYLDKFISMVIQRPFSFFTEQSLVWAIRVLKPDIVHSLEIQHAGYLALRVRDLVGRNFPVWIATNWGSDISLFGKIPEHQPLIRAIMQNCDYYSCECERDVQLAREMGFQGKVLPVLPNAGGVHIEYEMSFRQSGPVSNRKTIILKGYQNWAGRALVAFQAFRLCQNVLQGYTITVYSAGEDMKIAAQLFTLETGIPVSIIQHASHEEILKAFGKSRIYIGLSISDGISTSLLESMVMGAFPIQSCTACANEWIEDGKSGFIVPPEEPYTIADAIRKALTDNNLVNRAAEINAQTVTKRLDYSMIQEKVIEMYREIYDLQKE
jgi:hypothetical protein